MEENLFMVEHMAKNYDKAPRPAFLLSAGKHRVSPLHPPDLLRKALASPQTGSTGIVVVGGLNRHSLLFPFSAIWCIEFIIADICGRLSRSSDRAEDKIGYVEFTQRRIEFG